MPHLAALTSLRFFAALSVAYFHLQGIGFGSPFEPLALGVSFFFVLSGFVLTYAYGGKGDVKMRSFFVNRLARIWPAHLICAAAALGLFHSGMLYDVNWYPYVLTNLFMLHAWVPTAGHVFSLNSVTWSISAEIAFYSVFPLVLVARRPFAVSAVVLVGTLAAVCVPDFGTNLGSAEAWAFSPQAFIQQNPLVRFLEFFTGVLAGRVWLAGRRLPLSSAGMTWAEITTIAALLVFALTTMPLRRAIGMEGQQFGLWYSQSGGFLWFAALIFVFAHQGGHISRALSHPTLVLLGKVSFSFYMVHLLVIMWAKTENWVDRMGLEAAGLLIAAVSFGFAFVLWRLVEVPAQRVLTTRTKPVRSTHSV